MIQNIHMLYGLHLFLASLKCNNEIRQILIEYNLWIKINLFIYCKKKEQSIPAEIAKSKIVAIISSIAKKSKKYTSLMVQINSSQCIERSEILFLYKKIEKKAPFLCNDISQTCMAEHMYVDEIINNYHDFFMLINDVISNNYNQKKCLELIEILQKKIIFKMNEIEINKRNSIRLTDNGLKKVVHSIDIDSNLVNNADAIKIIENYYSIHYIKANDYIFRYKISDNNTINILIDTNIRCKVLKDLIKNNFYLERIVLDIKKIVLVLPISSISAKHAGALLIIDIYSVDLLSFNLTVNLIVLEKEIEDRLSSVKKMISNKLASKATPAVLSNIANKITSRLRSDAAINVSFSTICEAYLSEFKFNKLVQLSLIGQTVNCSNIPSSYESYINICEIIRSSDSNLYQIITSQLETTKLFDIIQPAIDSANDITQSSIGSANDIKKLPSINSSHDITQLPSIESSSNNQAKIGVRQRGARLNQSIALSNQQHCVKKTHLSQRNQRKITTHARVIAGVGKSVITKNKTAKLTNKASKLERPNNTLLIKIKNRYSAARQVVKEFLKKEKVTHVVPNNITCEHRIIDLSIQLVPKGTAELDSSDINILHNNNIGSIDPKEHNSGSYNFTAMFASACYKIKFFFKKIINNIKIYFAKEEKQANAPSHIVSNDLINKAAAKLID